MIFPPNVQVIYCKMQDSLARLASLVPYVWNDSDDRNECDGCNSCMERLQNSTREGRVLKVMVKAENGVKSLGFWGCPKFCKTPIMPETRCNTRVFPFFIVLQNYNFFHGKVRTSGFLCNITI